MTRKNLIKQNVKRWKEDQQRKAHRDDPDCPVDRSHVLRARACAKAVEDWVMSLARKVESKEKFNRPLTDRPFKF
jgi:hypothetical protein